MILVDTHAHLDHSGYVPALFASGHCNVYATPPTFDLTQLLIEDMLKIEKNFHPFDLPELNNMMKNSKKKIRKPHHHVRNWYDCYSLSTVGKPVFMGSVQADTRLQAIGKARKQWTLYSFKIVEVKVPLILRKAVA